MGHHNGGILQKGTHTGNLFRRDGSNDLQFSGRITSNNARNSSSGDALHVVGIGYDDTFDILDNTAAGTDDNLIRHRPQRFPGFGSAVGQRDGFGTAHGRDKLLPEDAAISSVFQIVFGHVVTLLSFSLNGWP